MSNESVIDIRSLIKGKVKKTKLSPELKAYFDIWKERMKEHNQESTELDIFYAGYILANPIIRDELRSI